MHRHYVAITDPLYCTTHMTQKVAESLIYRVWIISGLLSYIPIIVCEILNAPLLETADYSCYFNLNNRTMMVSFRGVSQA